MNLSPVLHCFVLNAGFFLSIDTAQDHAFQSPKFISFLKAKTWNKKDKNIEPVGKITR